MGNTGRGIHTLSSLPSWPFGPAAPSAISLLFGRLGRGRAEDLHQPRFHTASDFSGTQVGGNSSVMGLEPWTGGSRGWGCMAASQAEPKGAACPSHQVSLGQGEGGLPTTSPALINL